MAGARGNKRVSEAPRAAEREITQERVRVRASEPTGWCRKPWCARWCSSPWAGRLSIKAAVPSAVAIHTTWKARQRGDQGGKWQEEGGKGEGRETT